MLYPDWFYKRLTKSDYAELDIRQKCFNGLVTGKLIKVGNVILDWDRFLISKTPLFSINKEQVLKNSFYDKFYRSFVNKQEEAVKSVLGVPLSFDDYVYNTLNEYSLSKLNAKNALVSILMSVKDSNLAVLELESLKGFTEEDKKRLYKQLFDWVFYDGWKANTGICLGDIK
jgi:hypothetical protein